MHPPMLVGSPWELHGWHGLPITQTCRRYSTFQNTMLWVKHVVFDDSPAHVVHATSPSVMPKGLPDPGNSAMVGLTDYPIHIFPNIRKICLAIQGDPDG